MIDEKRVLRLRKTIERRQSLMNCEPKNAAMHAFIIESIVKELESMGVSA